MTQPTSAAQKVNWEKVGPRLFAVIKMIEPLIAEEVAAGGGIFSDSQYKRICEVIRATRESEDV